MPNSSAISRTDIPRLESSITPSEVRSARSRMVHWAMPSRTSSLASIGFASSPTMERPFSM